MQVTNFNTILIKFPNQDFAEHFMEWLSEIGEQSYYDEVDFDRKPCNVLSYDFTGQIITASYSPE